MATNTDSGRICCQLCGAYLPAGHPAQLAIRQDDQKQQYFVACCPECIATSEPLKPTALQPDSASNARSSRNSRRPSR